MRVFMSSVRKGLEDERDALVGHILALGHEPIRFEQFTAMTVPSRQACLEAVETADVYLLLMGPHYGDVFPETGKSPTHDEYKVAFRRGIPRIIMHKLNVEFDRQQTDFAREVESYTSGVFRKEFSTTAELLTEVTRVLLELAAAPPALSWRPLPKPLTEGYPSLPRAGQSRSAVVLRCVPVPSRRLTSMQLRKAGERLGRVVRACGLVPENAPLDSEQTSSQVSVTAPSVPNQRGGWNAWNSSTPGSLGGIRVDDSANIVAWTFLPSDSHGSLVDETSLTEELARLAGLVSQFDQLLGVDVSLGASLVVSGIIGEGNARNLGNRNSATMLHLNDPKSVDTIFDDSVPSAAVGGGAMEIGRELAVRLMQRFRESR